MQNRFGFKDFVVIVLLVLILVSIWLGMKQRDRQFDTFERLHAKSADLESRIAGGIASLTDRVGALDARVAELKFPTVVSVAAAPDAKGATPPPSATAPAPSATTPNPKPAARPGERDESWARAGAKVEWQEPWSFATDPAPQKGYQPGGAFTEVFEVRPAKLVPNIQTDTYGRRVVDQVVQSLGAYDPQTLKLRGVLAEAWQLDPDGMWFRAKIWDHAVFSDGVPVTAEDLRWSFHDFIMNTEIEAQRQRSFIGDQVDTITAISDKVVEIKFKKRLFSNLDTALTMYVLPKHYYSRLTPAETNKGTGLLLGSGPFRLDNADPASQWTPGQAVELVRNERYWGQRPPLDKMRFQDITDELARLTAYKNGDADMITPSSPQFMSLKNDPKFSSENQMLNTITMRSGRGGVIWNCGERGATAKKTPFHDKRVRQAMTMLLDREKMIRDIWSGVGIVAKGFTNPKFEGSDPEIKPWPFDPARAKALLTEAGWIDRDADGLLENEAGEPFEFEFTFFTGSEISQRIAAFLQDAYKAGGIRVVLRGVDWSVGDNIRKQRDYDAMFMAWSATAPESDPKQIFHSESIKDQGDNFGQWNSPRADAAIDALRSEVDFAKRMQHWREFERAMHDEQPYTWVRLYPDVRIIQPTIGNARLYPKGLEPWEFFRAAGPLLPATGQ